MKEKLYTIPVTDGFAANGECPLCSMLESLELKYADYFISGAHMEPDGRKVTNEFGFCRNHLLRMLQGRKNLLGLGLVLDTYYTEYIDGFRGAAAESRKTAVSKKKFGFFSGKSPSGGNKDFSSGKKDGRKDIINYIRNKDGSCAVCERIQTAIKGYIRTIFYLWEREDSFREKVMTGKGFCVNHFADLLENSYKYLKNEKAEEFCEIITGMQLENMEKIKNRITRYTLKADYRNDHLPWEDSKDALPVGIGKLKGYIRDV